MALRFVQAAFALLGVVAITAGLISVIGGAGSVPGVESAHPNLESELRFYSALWVALGCVAVWLVPRVANETLAARAVLAAVFAAGLARVISLVSAGAPDPLFSVLMAIELVFPPIVYAVAEMARRS